MKTDEDYYAPAEHLEQVKKENEQLKAKLEEAQNENTQLRVLIPALTGKCIHCGLENMALCKSGFPGCAWADDIFCEEAYLEGEARRLSKENEKLKKAVWKLVADLKSRHAVEENHNDCGLCYAVKRLSALVKEGKHANP